MKVTKSTGIKMRVKADFWLVARNIVCLNPFLLKDYNASLGRFCKLPKFASFCHKVAKNTFDRVGIDQ
jgi:hypothetical protein